MAGISIAGQLSKGVLQATASRRPALLIGSVQHIKVPYRKNPDAVSIATSGLIDFASSLKASAAAGTGPATASGPDVYDLWAHPCQVNAQVVLTFQPPIRFPTGPFGVSIPGAERALEKEGYSPLIVRSVPGNTELGFVVGQDRQAQNEVMEQMLRAGWYVPVAGMLAEVRALLTLLDPCIAKLVASGIGEGPRPTMKALFSGALESRLGTDVPPPEGMPKIYFRHFALGLLFGHSIGNAACGVFYEPEPGETWE